MRSAGIAFTLGLTTAGCARAKGNGEVEVVAHDYAFTAPDTLSSGPTVIRYRNAGKMRHEMDMVLLKTGVTVAQYVAAMMSGSDTGILEEPGDGVLFARPGASEVIRLAVDLLPGRHYLFVCNFADGAGMPRHTKLGMFKELTVRNSRGVVPTVPVHEVTVTASNYAFSLPETLPAGPTHFRMQNGGSVPHEMGIRLLKAGVTPAHALALQLKEIDTDSLYEPGSALVTAPAGTHEEFAMLVNLLPGRAYVLDCNFQDSPDKPRHFMMGMLRGVEVR